MEYPSLKKTMEPIFMAKGDEPQIYINKPAMRLEILQLIYAYTNEAETAPPEEVVKYCKAIEEWLFSE